MLFGTKRLFSTTRMSRSNARDESHLIIEANELYFREMWRAHLVINAPYPLPCINTNRDSQWILSGIGLAMLYENTKQANSKSDKSPEVSEFEVYENPSLLGEVINRPQTPGIDVSSSLPETSRIDCKRIPALGLMQWGMWTGLTSMENFMSRTLATRKKKP